MSEKRILQTLRAMAWERAKGELQAALNTFYGEYTGEHFSQFDDAVKRFIKEVEDNGLQE